MTVSEDADPRCCALELVADSIGRVRATDPADTAAALLAAWNGFAVADAAGELLGQDNPDDAILARNARPVLAAVAELLPTDASPAEVDEPGDHTAADVVRGAVLMLLLEVNTLLPQAAERARNSADRESYQHGTRLAYELSCCWEGRLSSFLNARSDIATTHRTNVTRKPTTSKTKRAGPRQRMSV